MFQHEKSLTTVRSDKAENRANFMSDECLGKTSMAQPVALLRISASDRRDPCAQTFCQKGSHHGKLTGVNLAESHTTAT